MPNRAYELKQARRELRNVQDRIAMSWQQAKYTQGLPQEDRDFLMAHYSRGFAMVQRAVALLNLELKDLRAA